MNQGVSDNDRASVVAEWSNEPNLDFLRSFAVLCVVARHLLAMCEVPARAWLQPQALGIFGVLIFFVHTSLVLMLSLQREQRRRPVSHARLYGGFLIRRVFRIYPLSAVAVLVVYFFIIPLGDPNAPRAGIIAAADPRMLWSNLFLVQDLVGVASMLGPLWSLPAEVQMYLLLPALYFLGRARGVRAIAFGAWPIAVVIAVVTWKLNLPLTVGRYAPCFVAGVLCYFLLPRSRRLPFWMFPLTLVAGLGVYMIVYARIGLQAGLGIVATLALALLVTRFARMGDGWLKPISHTVAKYSYGIYLFHTPCIWLAFGKLKFLGPAGSMLAMVVLVAASATLAYHAVEAPMIRLGKILASTLELES